MIKEQMIRPKSDDSEFFRNRTEVVRVVITDDTCYPRCKVRWLIPGISSRMDALDMDEIQKKVFYSIRVPGKFRSEYSEGYVSDLYEQEFLHEFMKEHGLQHCTIVINYLYRRTRPYIKGIFDCFAGTPECYVELLSKTEPANLEYEKVVYYSYDFPEEYRLVEGSRELLEKESEYRLMKSMHQYNKKEIIRIYGQLMKLYEQLTWKGRLKNWWRNFRCRFSSHGK